MAPTQQDPAGATMRFWLANTVKELRERAGLRLEDVAAHVQKPGYSQLHRFEAHESWPPNFDHVIAGYAQALGVEDPRELWQLALDRWRRHGTNPALDGHEVVRSSRRFVELVADQEARDRSRPRGELREATTATPKRRAAGR